jgi:hypothetical protein
MIWETTYCLKLVPLRVALRLAALICSLRAMPELRESTLRLREPSFWDASKIRRGKRERTLKGARFEISKHDDHHTQLPFWRATRWKPTLNMLHQLRLSKMSLDGRLSLAWSCRLQAQHRLVPRRGTSFCRILNAPEEPKAYRVNDQ